MGRKRFTKSEEQLKPDARFESKLVAKFINCLMWDGKKTAATRVMYDAMDIIEKRIKDASALEVFEQAVQHVRPNVEVRSKRVGGSNYQVPMQVNRRRQQSLAFRWLISASREKKGRPMAQRLAQELMDAFKNEGAAVTTRTNVHRMAEANKAFSHFAW